MNKPSKEIDFSSIVTQVPRNDDKTRSMPLSPPGIIQLTNGAKSSLEENPKRF